MKPCQPRGRRSPWSVGIWTVGGAARGSPTAPPEVSAGGHAIITIPGKANTLTDAPLSQFDLFQQVRPAMAAGVADRLWSVEELIREIG